MACTSGCPTQDCPSYGACLRGKNLATTGLESTGPGFGRSTQIAFEKENQAYLAAQRQGIQPAGVDKANVDAAVRASEATGKAYRADL